MCVSDFYIECMKVWFFYCFPYLNKSTTCIKVTLPQQGPLMNADMLNGDRTGVLEYSSIASASQGKSLVSKLRSCCLSQFFLPFLFHIHLGNSSVRSGCNVGHDVEKLNTYKMML